MKTLLQDIPSGEVGDLWKCLLLPPLWKPQLSRNSPLQGQQGLLLIRAHSETLELLYCHHLTQIGSKTSVGRGTSSVFISQQPHTAGTGSERAEHGEAAACSALGRAKPQDITGSHSCWLRHLQVLKCLGLCIWHLKLPTPHSPHLGTTIKPICKLSSWPKLFRNLALKLAVWVTLLQQHAIQTSQKSGTKSGTNAKCKDRPQQKH